jgi:hypothetical protein
MGAIDTSYTFTATDVITSTKMNNILDQSVIDPAAVFNNTLDVASGKLLVKAGGITSNELAGGSVNTAAIGNDQVTSAKLAADSVTTSKIVDGNVTGDKILNASILPTKLAQPLTLATSQNASGTSVDFTGIPSWAKRVTVMFNGVSTNGTASVLIQVGAGSVLSTGYLTSTSAVGSSVATVNSTSGFQVYFGTGDAIAGVRNGSLVLNLIASNAWSAQGVFGTSNTTTTSVVAGSVPLSNPLDRIRITTVGGANTFDAGSVNISYE